MQRKLWFGLFGLLLPLSHSLSVPATEPDLGSSNEAAIVLKLESGGAWDPPACPPEANTRIRADFLAALLTRWPELFTTNKERLPRVVSLAHVTFYGNIDLANLEVPFEVELTNCVFESEVNFSKTVFRRSLHLSGSRFAARAAFNAMVVGRSDWSGSLYIDSATFERDFDLTDATIERNLFATNATFAGAQSQARFAKLTVNGDAWFEGATFAGAAIFTQTEIKHGLFAARAQFNNQPAGAKFDDLVVGDDASFEACSFLGPVDFTDARIQGDLLADAAKFLSTEEGATFKSLKVSGAARLSKAVFSGPADFSRATIGAELDLTNSSFYLPSVPILFHEVKVEGDVVLDGTSFAGPASFHAMRVADELSMQGTHFNGTPKSACFDHMSVGGPAELRGANFNGEVHFDYSSFSTLGLDDVIWPVTLQNRWLYLEGLKYERVSDGGDDEKSWRRLVKLLGHATYNANAYADLEAFYQRIGHSDLADEIFFAQKHRERTDVDLHTSRGTKIWNGFLNVFVRYGRVPWLAFLWGMVFVLLGTLAFQKGKMEPQPREESAAKAKDANGEKDQTGQKKKDANAAIDEYNGFWYSLDLFAPVIDLKTASAWRPKRREHAILYHYSRLHRILGWILVPIGAAAVTGLTK